MTTPAPVPKHRMTVPEFLAWADRQDDGHAELVDGEIVAMAPDRVRHNVTKLAVATALQSAVCAAGAPCTVFTDGVGVVINDHTTRIPDASLQCAPVKADALVLDQPLVVVEVASPSSERSAMTTKFVEYFSVPSIRHYLVVVPEKRVVIHHARGEGDIISHMVREGAIALDTPGIAVDVETFLGPAWEDEE